MPGMLPYNESDSGDFSGVKCTYTKITTQQLGTNVIHSVILQVLTAKTFLNMKRYSQNVI